MKYPSLAAILLLCQPVWADAPVTDRSVAAEQVEAAQLRADLAWKKLDLAKFELTRAQQDVGAAEQADSLAQARAKETAKELSSARERLLAAQAAVKQAEAAQQQETENLHKLWQGPARPR